MRSWMLGLVAVVLVGVCGPAGAGVTGEELARGQYLIARNRPWEAAAIAVAALEQDPEDLAAHFLYQSGLYLAGQAAVADELYSGLHRLRPSSEVWRVALAMQLNMSCPRDCTAEVESLLDPLPDDPVARHFALVVEGTRCGMGSGTEACWDEALRAQIELADVGGITGDMVLWARVTVGPVDGALADELLRAYGERPWTFAFAPGLWRGDPEGPALELARQEALGVAAAVAEGDDPVLVHAAMEVFRAAGDEVQAGMALDRLQVIDPKGDERPFAPSLFIQRIRDLGRARGDDQAAALAELAGMDGDLPGDGLERAEWAFARAQLLEGLGRGGEALDAYLGAFEAFPDVEHSRGYTFARRLALAALREGRELSAAARAMDAALDAREEFDVGEGMLAKAWDYAKWREWQAEAWAQDLDTRARLARALDRPDEARRYWLAALLLDEQPHHHRGLGMLYRDQGETQLAFEHLARARALPHGEKLAGDDEVRAALDAAFAELPLWNPGGAEGHVRCVARAAEDAPRVFAAAPLERLAWLAGSWTLVEDGRTVEEQWMAPRGTSMVGGARTVEGEATVAYEHLRIELDGDRLVYVALPSGQAETRFAQVEIGEGQVAFENPDHDFPRRIEYRRRPDGALVVTVSGESDGETRSFELRMRPVE